MTNGTLTSVVRSWEEGDKSGHLIARVQTVLINAAGAALLTIVPADFGWNVFYDIWIGHDSAGVSVQWTITKNAAGDVTSIVSAANPAAGALLLTVRGA